MNAIGKFLESRLGTWCVLIAGTLLAPLPFVSQSAGIAAAVILGWLGLLIPQIGLYRQRQLAKHLAGEEEDD